MTPIGQLRIDISMEFFQKVCNFLYDQSEQFFIVDSDYHVIFASDPSAIGTMTSEPWIQSLIGQAADDDDLFVSKTSGDALRICQKLPGDSKIHTKAHYLSKFQQSAGNPAFNIQYLSVNYHTD